MPSGCIILRWNHGRFVVGHLEREYTVCGCNCVETEPQRQQGKGTASNSNVMVLRKRYCVETELQRQRGKGTAPNSNAMVLCIRYCLETEPQRQRGKGTAPNGNVMVPCIRYCLETESQRQRGKGTAPNSNAIVLCIRYNLTYILILCDANASECKTMQNAYFSRNSKPRELCLRDNYLIWTWRVALYGLQIVAIERARPGGLTCKILARSKHFRPVSVKCESKTRLRTFWWGFRESQKMSTKIENYRNSENRWLDFSKSKIPKVRLCIICWLLRIFDNFLQEKWWLSKKWPKHLGFTLQKNRPIFFDFARHRSERKISNRKFLLLNFAQLFENPAHIFEKLRSGFRKSFFFWKWFFFWNRRRIMFTKTKIRFWIVCAPS